MVCFTDLGTYGKNDRNIFCKSNINIHYVLKITKILYNKLYRSRGTTSVRFLKTIKRGKKDLLRLGKKNLNGFASPEDISKLFIFTLDLSNLFQVKLLELMVGKLLHLLKQ